MMGLENELDLNAKTTLGKLLNIMAEIQADIDELYDQDEDYGALQDREGIFNKFKFAILGLFHAELADYEINMWIQQKSEEIRAERK